MMGVDGPVRLLDKVVAGPEGSSIIFELSASKMPEISTMIGDKSRKVWQRHASKSSSTQQPPWV